MLRSTTSTAPGSPTANETPELVTVEQVWPVEAHAFLTSIEERQPQLFNQLNKCSSVELLLAAVGSDSLTWLEPKECGILAFGESTFDSEELCHELADASGSPVIFLPPYCGVEFGMEPSPGRRHGRVRRWLLDRIGSIWKRRHRGAAFDQEDDWYPNFEELPEGRRFDPSRLEGSEHDDILADSILRFQGGAGFSDSSSAISTTGGSAHNGAQASGTVTWHGPISMHTSAVPNSTAPAYGTQANTTRLEGLNWELHLLVRADKPEWRETSSTELPINPTLEVTHQIHVIRTSEDGGKKKEKNTQCKTAQSICGLILLRLNEFNIFSEPKCASLKHISETMCE
ncbi:CaiB/baiF CoA-transferase family protein [Pseudohyphozyma bogoriensis]|nr:CaiB/baiF CoA-transferase family protein [Pseudohyphozyma bogoriensis]